MRVRLTLLIQRLRRRRDAGRRHQDWYRQLGEPVVPTLRGWPVEPPRR